MLAKFSVKKPLTVLVAVILVLILGFVSFTSMTPDLLPNMDFPMAVLMTDCIPAFPEGGGSHPHQAFGTVDGNAGKYQYRNLQFQRKLFDPFFEV